MKMIDILKECWDNYEVDEFPKDSRMSILEDKEVQGMSTENIRFLVNELVRKYAQGGVYLEVGMLYGCSLLSAALFNPTTRCIGIDNFSQWDGSEDTLIYNFKKFGLPKNIEYYLMDYKEGIKTIFSKEPNLKVDIYCYDGDHAYQSQIDGLNIMLPHMNDKCIILVDDVDWRFVGQANVDWLKDHSKFESLKIRSIKGIDEQIKVGKVTPYNKRPWWNGFEIMFRGF